MSPTRSPRAHVQAWRVDGAIVTHVTFTEPNASPGHSWLVVLQGALAKPAAIEEATKIRAAGVPNACTCRRCEGAREDVAHCEWVGAVLGFDEKGAAE